MADLGGNFIKEFSTFLLNKLLFGIDVFYTVDLPKHYIFVHPIGTILGSGAIYSNYFVVY